MGATNNTKIQDALDSKSVTIECHLQQQGRLRKRIAREKLLRSRKKQRRRGRRNRSKKGKRMLTNLKQNLRNKYNNRFLEETIDERKRASTLDEECSKEETTSVTM